MTESRNTKLIVRSIVDYWRRTSPTTGESEPRYSYAQAKTMLKGNFSFLHAGERYVVACFDLDEEDARVSAFHGQFTILLKGKETLLVTLRENLLSMHTWIDDWLMGDRALLHALREALLEHWPLPEEFTLALEAKAAEHAANYHAGRLFLLRTMSSLKLKLLYEAGLEEWAGYCEAFANHQPSGQEADDNVKLLRILQEHGIEAWKAYEAAVEPLEAYQRYLESAYKPERAHSYEEWLLSPQEFAWS